ncbi:helix-turn-helix domain-containing protein [Kineosporia sp. J2-2]|uniref:Helix-turn-helix domain-containing protein n=1 Tax=Kineosporia corallincola TaxID=2835133 RepID=A0ABS5TEN6_9ACTN|nr:helix-turn-helix domain-containing protein [Kineosporia corallincola]MBT0769545.1 helix-turn-helix domain-containing protein [Kineosporia corallincola]
MENLALRLARLDPEAGSAVRVVRHFDALTESGAGLHSIVRAAAHLAGVPARLRVPSRGLDVRVLANGAASPAGPGPAPHHLAPGRPDVDPAWPCAVLDDAGAALWLELPGRPGTLPAVVLERAGAAARIVLGPSPATAVGLLVDASVPEAERVAAARRLHLPETVRAVAELGAPPRVVAAGAPAGSGARAGIGAAGTVAELPRSWEQARLALRLSADGDERDPGPRVVHADELGALLLLLRAAEEAPAPHPDVLTLDRAAATAAWVLPSLVAVNQAVSLRDAARALGVHHSTLQDRLRHAETLLGWNTRDRTGQTRLALAIALLRLHRTA